MPRKGSTIPLTIRLWDRVDKSGDCWLWQGRLARGGYGSLTIAKRTVMAHRLAWELANEQAIPEGMLICHRCDNPRCVRPEHLFLGTPSDNMKDMVAKGRARMGDRHPSHQYPERVVRGERHGRTQLTDATVLAIRARYASGNASHSILALEFGVPKPTVARILQRKNWTHI